MTVTSPALEELLQRIDAWAKYRRSRFDDFWRWSFGAGTQTPELPDFVDFLREVRIHRLYEVVNGLLEQLRAPYRGNRTYELSWEWIPRNHRVVDVLDMVQFMRRHHAR